jgi:hypothetical protein
VTQLMPLGAAETHAVSRATDGSVAIRNAASWRGAAEAISSLVNQRWAFDKLRRAVASADSVSLAMMSRRLYSHAPQQCRSELDTRHATSLTRGQDA